MPANESDSEPSGQSLPAGARLEEFVIEKVLGSGGFGITYLAKDTSLGRAKSSSRRTSRLNSPGGNETGRSIMNSG